MRKPDEILTQHLTPRDIMISAVTLLPRNERVGRGEKKKQGEAFLALVEFDAPQSPTNFAPPA